MGNIQPPVSATVICSAPMETRAAAARRHAAGACAICGEQGPTARPYECGHLFHTSCLLHWCQYENSCPVCREFFNYVMCADQGVIHVEDAVQHDDDVD